MLALLLAGCGGGASPKLARGDAAPLISLAARVPGEGRCAQAHDIATLQHRTIALVNAGRVPPSLQEPLLSGVNDLASRAPACTPAAQPARTAPTQTQPPPQPPGHPDERGKGHDKERGKAHGKGHGGGKGRKG